MHLSSPLPGSRFVHRRQRVRQGVVDVEPVRRSNINPLPLIMFANLHQNRETRRS